MSDIDLFRLDVDGSGAGTATRLSGRAEHLERDLQNIFETNLQTLLGVRFIRSELVVEGGRLDTIGIDENDAPVVIEYKRQSSENVVNQGLFYLDWIVSHRGDFEMIVVDKEGQDAATSLNWPEARLICVASEFNKYDLNAVRQMGRKIDLVRYRKYDELLLLELLNPRDASPGAARQSAKTLPNSSSSSSEKQANYKTVATQIAEAPVSLKALVDEVRDAVCGFADDIEVVTTNFYIAFRRLRNVATMEVRNTLHVVRLYLVIEPTPEIIEDGFTRDMTGKGHFGSGDVEVTIRNSDDLERAMPLIERAVQEG